MKFILKDEIEIDWPVTIRVPVNDGRFQEQKITARFKLLDQDKVDEALAGDAENADAALMRAVFIGWKEVFGEDGEAIPFSEEARDMMLGKPFIRLALARAYFDANTGGGGRRKN